MNEPASKEPSNKKADDDAIRQFVAEHETGVIAPEVAEAFDYRDGNTNLTAIRLAVDELIGDLTAEERDDD